MLWENSDSFHEIAGRSYGYGTSIFIYCATRTIGIHVGGWQWYICTTTSVRSPIRSSLRERRWGYGSIATEAGEQEVPDQLLRGQVHCFFVSALNERDTLPVRGRTTSAPGPSPFEESSPRSLMQVLTSGGDGIHSMLAFKFKRKSCV